MRLLSAMLITVFAGNTLAQTAPTAKQVICYELSAVVKILREDYNETVKWQGENSMTEGSKIALAENTETGTWTIIEYDNRTACILGMGQNPPSQRL